MMKPIQVQILDSSFNRVTGSIPYTSLAWERRYYEPGQFMLVVGENLYSPDWAYVYTDARPELGMIQSVEIDDSSHAEDGIDRVVLSGFFAEERLNWFVFLVEQTEQQAYYIPKPVQVIQKKPKFVENASTGEIFLVHPSADGSNYYTSVKDGSVTKDPGEVGTVEIEAGDSVKTAPEDYGRGEYYKSGYDYYVVDGGSDGKLHAIDAAGDEHEYTLVGEPFGRPDGTGNHYAIYLDDDGSLKWTTGVAASVNGTYGRRINSWEERTEGLEKVTLDNGSIAAVAYREVRGPWQLRTDVGQVGQEMDNVQQIIAWAQLCFGNQILYDEVGFVGETKVLDPSLQRVGDVFFNEMKTIGASVRLFYDFESNTFAFSVWRGLDRSKDDWFLPEEEPRLPEGYQELEYIKASGRYIDTGFKPDQDTRVSMEVEVDSGASGNQAFFGSRLAQNRAAFVLWATGSTVRSDYGTDQLTLSGISSHDVRQIDKNGRKITVNGVSFNNDEATFSTNTKLSLFGVNTNGTVSGFLSASLYSCEVYDGAEKVRDYVPARRTSDSALGLYDLVNGTFTMWSGSGTVTAGPDVGGAAEPEPILPDGFTELQYVESNGSNYVDTDYTPGVNTRVDCDFEVTAATDNTHRLLFGSRYSSSQRQFAFGWAGHSGGVWRSDYGANQTKIGGVAEVGRHTLVKNKGVTTLDSVQKNVTNTSFVCPGNLYVFGNNDNGNAAGFLPARLYSMQVYDNGTLVRDFRPAKRDSDGKVGLYDLSTQALYVAKGTGDLKAGPAVEYPTKPTGTAKPWAVFSDTWGTLYDYSYCHDESGYRNKCYVMYDFDEPGWNADGTVAISTKWEAGKVNPSTGEGSDWKMVYYIPRKKNRGYKTVRLDDGQPDKETWLDLREEKPDGYDSLPDASETYESEEDLPDLSDVKKENWDAFKANLDPRGRKHLQDEYPMVDSLDTGTLWMEEYMRSYDLGDIVDMEVSKVGMVRQVRITGVTEVYESSGTGVNMSIALQLGEEKDAVYKRAQRN